LAGPSRVVHVTSAHQAFLLGEFCNGISSAVTLTPFPCLCPVSSHFIRQRTILFMAVFSPIQLIASIPPVTRFVTAATVLLSLCYIYPQWKSDAGYPVPYLTLVPGSSLFYPWTFFTSVFVETSIYEVRRCPHFQPNTP
jgi:hypothetical protein